MSKNDQNRGKTDTPGPNLEEFLDFSPLAQPELQQETSCSTTNAHNSNLNNQSSASQYDAMLSTKGKQFKEPNNVQYNHMYQCSNLNEATAIEHPGLEVSSRFNDGININVETETEVRSHYLPIKTANRDEQQSFTSSSLINHSDRTPAVLLETPFQESHMVQSCQIPSPGLWPSFQPLYHQQNQPIPQVKIEQVQSQYQYSFKQQSQQQSGQYLDIDFRNPSFHQPQSYHSPGSSHGDSSVLSELSSVENSPYLPTAASPSNYNDDRDEQLFSLNDGISTTINDNGLPTINGASFLELNTIGDGIHNVNLSRAASEVSFHDVISVDRNSDIPFELNSIIRDDHEATGLTSNNGDDVFDEANFGNSKLTQDNLIINDRNSKMHRKGSYSPVTISIETADQELNFRKPEEVESLFSNSNHTSRTNSRHNSRHNSERSSFLKAGHFKQSLSANGDSDYLSTGVFDDDDDDEEDDEEDDSRAVKGENFNSYLRVDPDQQHSNMRQSRQRRKSNNSSRSRSKSRSRDSENREKMLELASPSQQQKKTQKHPSIYSCHLCDKRFTRPYNLKSHLRTHTDERPFVCSVCGKAFARQHDRKRHEDLHSGHKKFQCLGTLRDGVTQWGCGKKFARTDALGRHFKTEAGKICIAPLVKENEEELRTGGNGDHNKFAVPKLEVTSDEGDLPKQLYSQFPSLR